MTPIELTDNGLLDNLPLLTQVADEDAPDDLPTLTEVVTDETTGETTSHPTKQPEDGCQVVGYSHSTRLSKDDSQVAGYEGQTEPSRGLQPNADREIPVPENETSHAHFPLPNPLGETTSHSTRLRETAAKSLVIPQAGEGANESLREFHVSEEEVQRLLRRLETHLENRFANKLSVNLEQLQRQAIDHAVSELKAELPELLREMLNTPLHP
ncbi:MAG: hypothetical protein Q8O58_00650 [Gallionella sp.]|nr:hypothetical protein [Gallionella sp.]